MEEEEKPKVVAKKDIFDALYKELLKKPQGDVIVARIKAFLG